MSAPLLSIVVPAYNEQHTITEIIARVRAAPLGLAREVVVVDDASQDETATMVEKLIAQGSEDLRLVRHPVNRGKGAAIRTGLAEARGDIIIIQDAASSTTRATIPRCSSRFSRATPTPCSATDSTAAPTACSTSGTTRPTGCSPSSRTSSPT